MPARDHCQNKKMNACADSTPKKVEKVAARGQCYVFFVYRYEFDRRVKNAVIRFSQRIRAYDGIIMGASTRVIVDAPKDNPWMRYNDWCITGMAFPSQEKAKMWFVSEPEVKQPDFPLPSNGFMVFSVPIRYIPKPDLMTFCWTETKHILDKCQYQTEYVDKLAELLDNQGVSHGVVFLTENENCKLDRLKDCYIDQGAHFRLDLFRSEHAYSQIVTSAPYEELKKKCAGNSLFCTVVFTLDPKISC